MQKLSVELKNTPRNTSPVPCSVNEMLNKVETLSASHIVLTDNNSEENLQSGKTGHNLRVYVLNMRNDPLMPTTPCKARKLLKQNRAKVIQRTPFTIQLLYATGESKQPITLGIDPGYSYIGYSAVSESKELISGEVELRSDIKRLLQKRSSYRKTRRSRLWHRPPRFNNRSKPEGWLPPSIQHKLDTHLNLIDKLKSILPITSTIIEITTFDQQKMQNPEISGIEYQQGTLQGYNIREYLLEKFKHKCAYCGKSNIPLEIEHIIPKSRNGSNRISNLTIACHNCNQSKGNLTAEEFGHPHIQAKAKKTLRSTAFMNIVKQRLFNTLIKTDPNTSYTYGYITKRNRILHNISKSHNNDAFIIANGSTQSCSHPYNTTCTRRNNRSIQTNRKGYKPSIRKQRYSLQPNDLVKRNNILYKVKGVFNYGKWIRLVDASGTIINSNIKKVELITYGKGIQFSQAQFIPPHGRSLLWRDKEHLKCTRCGRCCSELGQNRMMVSNWDIARWIDEKRWDILKNVTQCIEGSWLNENSCYDIIKEKGLVQCHTCRSGGAIINKDNYSSGDCIFLKKEGEVFMCSIEETKPDHCDRWRVGEYYRCPQHGKYIESLHCVTSS